MKQLKKILCSILVVVLVMTSMPLSGFVGLDFANPFSAILAYAEEVLQNVETEPETEGVTWTFNEETGELRISGQGDMWDCYISDEGYPWEEYKLITKKLIIGDGITRIGFSAFEDFLMSSVEMSDTVVEISDNAFHGCENLENINFSKNLELIDEYAFSGCDNLKKIEIPENIKQIRQRAFYYCENLSEIKLPENGFMLQYGVFEETAYYNNEENWEDGNLYIGNHFIEADKSIQTFEIKLGTYTIGGGAFDCYSELKDITIPDSVTHIGDFAFADCYNLTSVTLPDSVTSIGDYAFAGTSIETIIFGENVEFVGCACLSYCANLSEITFLNPEVEFGVGYPFNTQSLNTDAVTIYGYKNSTAEELAEDCSIKFVVLPCSHKNTVDYDEIPATCADDGITAGTYCEDCQNWTVEREIIPASHVLTDEPKEVAATCLSDGYSIRFCTVCGMPDGKWETVEEADYPVLVEETAISKSMSYIGIEIKASGKRQVYSCHMDNADSMIFNLKYTCDGTSTLIDVNPTVNIFDSFGNEIFSSRATSADEYIEIEGNEFTVEYIFFEEYTLIGDSVLTNSFSISDLKVYHIDDSKVKTEDKRDHYYIPVVESFPQQCNSDDNPVKSICIYCGKENDEPVTQYGKNKYRFEFNVTAKSGSISTNDIRIIYRDNNGDVKNTTIPDVNNCFAAVGTTYYDFELDGVLIGYSHKRTLSIFGKLEYNVVFYNADENDNYRKIDRVTLSGNGEYSTQTSHALDETVITEPTCTQTGVKHTVCGCGFEEDVSVTALGHDYSVWVSDGQGKHSRVCSRDDSHIETADCSDSEPEIIAPTCTLEGYNINTCDECLYSWTDNAVAAAGHTVGDDVSITESDCSVLGKKTYTCTVCGEFIEESLPLGSHDYESTTVEPTCTGQGYTTYVCSVCGDSYTDSLVAANGHSYSEWNQTEEPTCEKAGVKERTCSVCDDVDTEEIPELGHTEESVVTSPTCSERGYTTYMCTVCGSERTADFVMATGHTNTVWTETVAPTCTAKGTESSKCDICSKVITRKTDSLGHNFGDWYTEKEPTVLEEGISVRLCGSCNAREEESIDRLVIDFEENDSYGLANFTVVDAQTLAPIKGASIFVTTEVAGEDTFFTDKDGKVSVVLPVGEAKVSVYIDGCQVRNFKYEIKAGVNDIPQIGLSSGNIYEADLTVKEMTYNEILDAGIDTSAPGNTHIEKYELTFQFDPQKDAVSINAYYNEDGECVNIDTDSDDDEEDKIKSKYRLHYHVKGTGYQHTYCKYVTVKRGETVKLDYLPDVSYDDYEFNGWYSNSALKSKITSVTLNSDRTVYGRLKNIKPDDSEPDPEPDPEPNPSITAGDYTVYPVSENMYLIIKGEISWLKEMFDVRLLVFNRSMTDTLSSLTAEIVLPDGLSLAEMSSDAQSLVCDMNNIKGGEYGCAQWYIRGDEAGTYDVRANLTGEILPFGEKINDTFSIDSAISVIAENALQMNIEIPDTVYYGKDFPAKITLTNVSGKTIHKVSHILTGVEQTSIVHYSNGEKKSTCFMNEAGTVAKDFATVFEPGDQLVFDLNITAKYVSELMEYRIEQYLEQIDIFEGTNKVCKVVVGVAELITSIKGLAASAAGFNIATLSGKNIPVEKMKLVSEIISTSSQIVKIIDVKADCIADSPIGSLVLSIGSIVSPILKTFADPKEAIDWVRSSSISDMSSLLTDLKGYINACERAAAVRNFNVFDAMRAAISAIPVAFVLEGVIFRTDYENSTVSIPKSYTTTKAEAQYFGVDDVNKYLKSISEVYAIKTFNDFSPSIIQLLAELEFDEIYVENVEYILATQEKINQVKITNQENAENGGVKVKSWIEPMGSSTYSLRRTAPASAEDLFELSCSDNETAVYEDGVLTFSGSGTLDVVPKGNTNGVLHIEREDGTKVEVDLIVVEEHDCEKARHIIMAPTEDSVGYAVDYCSICEEVMDVIELDAAACSGNHTYSKWETLTEADCVASGIRTRSCINCGYTETDFSDALGHRYSSETTTEPTCTKEGINTFTCSVCDDSYTEAIDKKEHTASASTMENRKEAKCEENGSYDEVVYCSVCNEELSRTEKTITATGHSYTSEITEPTCTEDGFTTYTCSACGDNYTADYIDALKHTGGTANCKDKAVCTRCNTAYGEFDKNNHKNIVTDKAVDATCKAPGLTEGSHCEACGVVIKAQNETDLLKHSYQDVVTAPTCTEDGYTTYTCSACSDKYTDDKVDKLGHTGGTANCKDKAVCTRCNSDYGSIDKNNHKNIVTDKAVAATCTATGFTEGTHCDACGVIIEKRIATDKLAHNMSGFIVVVKPGCTDAGAEKSTCSACGHSESKSIPATGHNYENGICKNCGDSKAANCSHMCHKNNFIWKILLFFFKLFKIQPVCDCGVKHY